MKLLDKLAREWKLFQVLRRTTRWIDDISPESSNLVPDDLERSVDLYPNNVAFRFEGRMQTYAEFDALANRVANWGLAQGFKPGDAVALFMDNRLEYVPIWFGLSKIGVVTGLINNHLSGKALAHCVNIANARAIITGAGQDSAILSVDGLLVGNPTIWTLGGEVGSELAPALDVASNRRPDRTWRAHLKGIDLCLLVYTSGTTGLPKAARLTHARTQSMMRTFIGPCNTTERDRVYITLPLYHSTGGLCAVGIALMTGARVILRRKFSASTFWSDCADEGVTTIVYVGELCRYLINQPIDPREQAHNIRTGFGNGLRPDIWEEFHARFNIPQLVEFYGSTEGNVSVFNGDGKIGAVGRIPKWLEFKFAHVAFVKFDIVTEQPIRGPDGFCIATEPNEVGEAIGRIGEATRTRFEGYNDPAATNRKILHDVFEKGDMWFGTGDLMRKDEEGYIYFVDRIGDTFRWKGENVSTNEVAEVLSRVPGIATANVYGVPIPGTDGKAGMAAITTKGDVDYDGLYKLLASKLPKYAIPIFIRIQRNAETTGTFKYRKVDLVREGFDTDEVDDPMWYADPDLKRYEPLTMDAYDTIKSGSVRF